MKNKTILPQKDKASCFHRITSVEPAISKENSLIDEIGATGLHLMRTCPAPESPIDNVNMQSDFNKDDVIECSQTLTMFNDPEGILILSDETMNELNCPKKVKFGFFENSLVLSTGSLDSREIGIINTGAEGIIQDPDIVYEIVQKMGLNYGTGYTQRFYLSDLIQLGNEFYAFFLPQKKVAITASVYIDGFTVDGIHYKLSI